MSRLVRRATAREVIELNEVAPGQQMTPAQARVVDPVLTSAARGYQPPMFIGQMVAPRVETPVRGGRLIEFNLTSWRKLDTQSSDTARVRRVRFGYEGKPFQLNDHDLEGQVSARTEDEAQAIGLDLSINTVMGVQDILELEREIEIAELVTKTANFKATLTTALAGNSRWDTATATPTANVMTAVEAVRAEIGRRPNLVVLGPKVFRAVRTHAGLLTQVRERKDSIGVEDLQSLWDVERVVVGDAIYVDADETKHDVWGKNALICYTRIGRPARPLPSFAYCYQLRGAPVAMSPYYEPQTRSMIYPVSDVYATNIVGKDAGYLYTTVVA